MTDVSCSTRWIVHCFVRSEFAFLANTPSWTVCVWITVQTTGLQRVGVGRTQERMRIRRLCPPRSQILLHHVVPSYSCFPGYCASQRPLLLPPLVYLKVCRTESAVLPTPGRVSHCKEIIFWTFCPYLDRTVKVKLTGVTLGTQAATHHIWPKWWPQELEKKKKKKKNNTSVPVSCMNTSDWLQKGVSGRTGLEECFRRTLRLIRLEAKLKRQG